MLIVKQPSSWMYFTFEIVVYFAQVGCDMNMSEFVAFDVGVRCVTCLNLLCYMFEFVVLHV